LLGQGITGYILLTEAIGCDPNDHSSNDYSSISSKGNTPIVRLNNGYGSIGTIPTKDKYNDFCTRVSNFVANSKGASIWIIGNEMNLAAEWPNNQPIQVSDYITVFTCARNAIKKLPGHSNDMVIPGAIGTWCASNPNACVGDWLQYFVQLLTGLNGQLDGIAIHTYTHGSDPNLVFSNATMNPPYQDRYYHFRAYRNYMNSIPSNLRHLPVYITETDQVDPWADTNSGWVQNVYTEINNWNAAGNQKIRAVCLYRWGNYDQWTWSNKRGVQLDFVTACTKRYKWTN